MAPQHWQQIKEILGQALEREEGKAREAFVAETCGHDTTLRREIETYLNISDQKVEACAENLRHTLLDKIGTHHIGRRVGAYRIVQEIGRGGMGTVFLAARADGQFEKQVAIKLLKRGTDTDEIVRRFRAERQILARLEHQSIARLLDAGTTDDGLPYFVMEYVAGEPITKFIRDQQLSIRQQLELFLKVCTAVEQAHRGRIVHRDLKPTNILVTADGQPKLLDFGIAKLLEPGNTLDATATSQQRLTPTCASPEQARGEQVTTASDIYALGALLYEMLTERKPHQFSTARPSSEELARVVCEQEPKLPNLVASGRGTQRQLQGDLDNIVLYALRKEPERRYASVAEFAEDIRRYLAARPVHARPNTTIYRVQRFFARNKGAGFRLGVTAGAILALAAGGMGLLFFLNPNVRSLTHVSVAPEGKIASPVTEKSIAVLPFENLTVEKENAFFTDGVQGEILTELAKVAELKVIGPASVQQYKSGAPRDLREIGRQLGAAHLLEGSVQRANGRVRVTAHLSESKSGTQLWAESYERDLTDVFGIQNDIAQAIVRRLQAKLLPQEKAGIEEPPTRDVPAYDRYLRAKAIVTGYLDDPDPNSSLREAIQLLDEAVERDPNFTLAYCFAARAHSLLFGLRLDRKPDRVREAERAVRKALSLQPASAEVHLALAEFYYRSAGGFQRAENELEIARPGLPNSSHFYVLAGSIYRRLGKWEEAGRSYAKAVELDPRSSNAINLLADNQVLMRRYGDAAKTCQNAIAAGIGTPFLTFWPAVIDFAASGDAAKFRASLAALPPEFDLGGAATPQRILMALMQHDYDGAARVLGASPRDQFQEIDFTYFYPRSWYEALIARARGDATNAHEAFARTRPILEERLRLIEGDAKTLAVLAQVEAGLGEKEAAIQHGERAAKLRPVTADAYDGAIILQGLAQVYTWTGETSRALDALEHLARIPGYLSYGYLRVDPAWEPLRGEARFEAITASLAPRDPAGARASEDDESIHQSVRRTASNLQEQATLLEQAVARDPTFVPALCLLARVHLLFYFFNFDRSVARLDLAKKALGAAARVAPHAGEVHLTWAIFFYWGNRDYASALSELETLDPRQAQIAELRFFGGLTVEEIAKVLKISAATVKREWATPNYGCNTSCRRSKPRGHLLVRL